MNQLSNPIPIDFSEAQKPTSQMKRSRFLGGIYLGKIIYYKQQETAAITDQILDPAWAEPQLQLPTLHH